MDDDWGYPAFLFFSGLDYRIFSGFGTHLAHLEWPGPWQGHQMRLHKDSW
jgi:hypothetical protein